MVQVNKRISFNWKDLMTLEMSWVMTIPPVNHLKNTEMTFVSASLFKIQSNNSLEPFTALPRFADGSF